MRYFVSLSLFYLYNMKRTINTTKLTKAFIESRISQEDIVAKYLDISINVVDDCVKHNHLISLYLEMMILIVVWVLHTI